MPEQPIFPLTEQDLADAQEVSTFVRAKMLELMGNDSLAFSIAENLKRQIVSAMFSQKVQRN